MDYTELRSELGNMDIYLLDQVLKGRFIAGQKILDAGCGGGRNLVWFVKNGFDVCAMDRDPTAVAVVSRLWESFGFMEMEDQFKVGAVENIPWESHSFDHVICNAVLHFADGVSHFRTQFEELFRVLKPGGQLFVRMTSDFGIEEKVKPLGSNKFLIPDGSVRFLLTMDLLNQLEEEFSFEWLEPLKTVNVNGVRCMSTLILKKLGQED